MEFLTKELTNIGGFSIALWHVIVAVAVVVLLVLGIVAICRSAGKRNKNNTAQTVDVVDEPVATDEVVTDETDDELVDEVIVTIDEEADDDEIAEPTVDVADEPVVEPAAEAEQPVAEQVAKKRTVKNYHIALRPDGKWQVKLSKGGKAIKLFDTQAEAIAFAKARAKSQDGHITIHKVDGKIRKQKY